MSTHRLRFLRHPGFWAGIMLGALLGYSLGARLSPTGVSSASADSIGPGDRAGDHRPDPAVTGERFSNLTRRAPQPPSPQGESREATRPPTENPFEANLARFRDFVAETGMEGGSEKVFLEFLKTLEDSPKGVASFYKRALLAGANQHGHEEQLQWLVANHREVAEHFADVEDWRRTLEGALFRQTVEAFQIANRLQELTDQVFQLEDMATRNHLIERIIPEVFVMTSDYSQIFDLPTDELRDGVGRRIIDSLNVYRNNRAVEFYFSEYASVIQDEQGEVLRGLITPRFVESYPELLAQIVDQNEDPARTELLLGILDDLASDPPD